MSRFLYALIAFLGAVAAAPQDNTGLSFGKPLDSINKAEATALPRVTSYSEESSHEGDKTTLQDEDSDDTATTPSGEKNTEVTEKTTLKSVVNDKKKSPSPRFVSKLSYFKNSEEDDPNLLNYIERTSKRRFRSKCRCEKITNCPKLQISVPRCPTDYFMCCF